MKISCSVGLRDIHLLIVSMVTQIVIIIIPLMWALCHINPELYRNILTVDRTSSNQLFWNSILRV